MSDIDAREILLADGWRDSEIDRYLAQKAEWMRGQVELDIDKRIARQERRRFARRPEPPTGFSLLDTTRPVPLDFEVTQ